MEKCGKIWKNGHFSGQLWPDRGNTTRATMARLGSIGWYFFGKMWKNKEKQPFFRAAIAGLGKYHTGYYGWIGVKSAFCCESRVECRFHEITLQR